MGLKNWTFIEIISTFWHNTSVVVGKEQKNPTVNTQGIIGKVTYTGTLIQGQLPFTCFTTSGEGTETRVERERQPVHISYAVS